MLHSTGAALERDGIKRHLPGHSLAINLISPAYRCSRLLALLAVSFCLSTRPAHRLLYLDEYIYIVYQTRSTHRSGSYTAPMAPSSHKLKTDSSATTISTTAATTPFITPVTTPATSHHQHEHNDIPDRLPTNPVRSPCIQNGPQG